MAQQSYNFLTIRDFKRTVEYSLDHNLRRAILGLGAPGIGKSQMIASVAKARDIGFIDLRLLLYSETDLKGIPFPDETDGTTRWFPNKILPQKGRDKAQGILLIDELTSAPKRVQAAAYQLIQDYRLGEYEIPDGWFIIACGNREDDDGVFVQMPSPLANRFEIHDLRVDLEQWKADFAYPCGVHPSVIGYLNFSPKSIHTQEPGQNSMKFASPRSWTAVSDILNSGADINDSVIRFKVAGNIGDVQASAFFEFLRLQDSLVDADTILNGKENHVPEDKSLLYLTLSSIVSKMSILSSIKFIDEATSEKLLNAFNYMLKCPPEYMVVGFRDMTSLNPRLVKTFMAEELDNPNVADFIRRNNYLFE